jgi:hypothetical protein
MLTVASDVKFAPATSKPPAWGHIHGAYSCESDPTRPKPGGWGHLHAGVLSVNQAVAHSKRRRAARKVGVTRGGGVALALTKG